MHQTKAANMAHTLRSISGFWFVCGLELTRPGRISQTPWPSDKRFTVYDVWLWCKQNTSMYIYNYIYMQVTVKTGCCIMLCASFVARVWAMSYFYVFLILSRTTKPVPKAHIIGVRCFSQQSIRKKMWHCTDVTKQLPPCCEFNSSQSFSRSCSLSFLDLAKTERNSHLPGKPSWHHGRIWKTRNTCRESRMFSCPACPVF